ncbi:MAG: hypothetical protein LUQ65_07660 [Candidatus Helarchaeota archaeon]|nr:hypothetical protein [Candidatus Helarchaeota archaeon]
MSPDAKEDKTTYVTIFIHEDKPLKEATSNVISNSGIIRVRGFLKKDTKDKEKKEKTLTTLSYKIPIKSLGIEENADKKTILDKLLNPVSILNKDTKAVLMKLLDQYGDIKEKGRDRLEYKTERFKKKWKMKVRRVGGV